MKLKQEDLKRLDDFVLNNPNIINFDFEERVEILSNKLDIDKVIVEEYLVIVFSNDAEKISELYN